MTDPLIELARKSVPTIWCRNDIILRCAADAMKAQKAMIVELARIEADEVQSLGQNSVAAKALRKFADQIEQDEYLKGRG